MTLEIGILFALLAAMVYLFLTEKLPVDLTAFLGLSILVLGGYVAADQAFTGFASSAVITMLAIFIVSAALLHTGMADVIGERIHAMVGGKEVPLIILLMTVAGVLSAFMNNIAATAVLMPAVASVARRAGISPSRLFMPLAFGAILGGTTTQVGTPPNILAAAMLEERGIEPFGLFDFTPMGFVLLGVGVLYMITLGRKLLPVRGHEPELAEARDPAQVYHLNEKLFSIRIPPDSHLAGRTLGEARLGSALGVQVAAIVRAGKRRLAPQADTALEAGDVLLVKGRYEDLHEMLKVQGVEVKETSVSELAPRARGVGGIHMRVRPGSGCTGRSLRELRFRERFGVVVIGIAQGGALQREELGDLKLAEGDEVFALGTRPRLEELSAHQDFEVLELGLGAVRQLEEHLFVLLIPKESSLAGVTVRGSRIGELVGLTVAGVIRDGETRLAVSPEEVLRPGDQLLIAGEPARIQRLLELGNVELDAAVEEADIESEAVGLVEVALAPRSGAAGKTLADLDFRERFGLQVLALWREGASIDSGLASVPLRFGDSLLVQGSREKIRRLATDSDFVVLSQAAQVPRRRHKAPFAIGGLLLMIGLVVSGWQPINVAAFVAASLVVLSGAITMQEAYRAIEWRAIFLVAAVLPVGIAMEETGAALLLSKSVSEVAGPLGPYAVLASLVLLSSLLSQGLDGAPAVVLLTPVALKAAEQMGISPYPIMMGVGLAASAAFMTPFSHKANLLVMGAGGYRSMDYVKVGTPLTVVVLVLLVLLVPVFFPFYVLEEGRGGDAEALCEVPDLPDVELPLAAQELRDDPLRADLR